MDLKDSNESRSHFVISGTGTILMVILLKNEMFYSSCDHGFGFKTMTETDFLKSGP